MTNPETELIASRWRQMILAGSKRQRRLFRFFEPYFVERGVDPIGINEATLKEILDALPDDAAKSYSKQPDMSNQNAANAFIYAIADIETRICIGLPRLSPIAGPMSVASVAKEAFKTRFAQELNGIFVFYRLPEIHANENAVANLQKLGREIISTQNKAGIINGLFNAFNVVAKAIGAPDFLIALCAPAARPILTKAAKTMTNGKSIQMWRSLSQVAQAHGNFTAAKGFDRAASQIIANNDLTVIGSDLLSRLEPFSDITTFVALGAALVTAAKFNDTNDLTKKVILVRVGSALAALVALGAPARFDIIEDGFFRGRPDPARAYQRSTLFSAKHGSLEETLNPGVRDLIDTFYRGFFVVFGLRPASLMVGADGNPRKGGQESINKILKRLDADLTAKDLRDLAVFRMAWAGDDIDVMIKATRLSGRYFKTFFKPMLDDIAEQKVRK